jgi:hypothetical protein
MLIKCISTWLMKWCSSRPNSPSLTLDIYRTQPLIDDADSDRERPTMVEGYIDEELAAHPVMLPHFVEEKFRSPVNLDEFFQTPRKARWNKKVRSGHYRGFRGLALLCVAKWILALTVVPASQPHNRSCVFLLDGSRSQENDRPVPCRQCVRDGWPRIVCRQSLLQKNSRCVTL